MGESYAVCEKENSDQTYTSTSFNRKKRKENTHFYLGESERKIHILSI